MRRELFELAKDNACMELQIRSMADEGSVKYFSIEYNQPIKI